MNSLPKNLPGLLTEVAALDRWCPFVNSNCRGSRCMLWRWGCEIDKQTGDRRGWCGAGGPKGAWSSVPIRKESVEPTRPIDINERRKSAKATADDETI